MLGLGEDRCLAVDPGPRVDQVDGVELVAAVVALVAARPVVAADRAGSLDVPIGQGASGRRRDGRHRGLRHQVAVAVHGAEQLLHHGVVVAGGGPGEQVVGQPEALQVLHDHPVVPVGELARGDPLGVGLHQDRRAVLVRPRDHQHVVARHPLVAGEDVGGDAESGHVADVAGAVGVGPGHRGEDGGAHSDQVSARPRGASPEWARPPAPPQRPPPACLGADQHRGRASRRLWDGVAGVAHFIRATCGWAPAVAPAVRRAPAFDVRRLTVGGRAPSGRRSGVSPSTRRPDPARKLDSSPGLVPTLRAVHISATAGGRHPGPPRGSRHADVG